MLYQRFFIRNLKEIKKKNFIFFFLYPDSIKKKCENANDVFINNFSNLNASLYIFGGGTDINMFKYYVKKGFAKN